jgi:preprotein translocase subunit SecA
MSRSDASLNFIFGGIIGGREAKRLLRLMVPYAQLYAGYADDQLVAEFRQLIDVPHLGRHLAPNELSLRRLAGYEFTEDDARMLALACELFTRRPPRSQTPGTQLYDQQILAAIHLMRGSLVQMDTGEGKTFALMVAACALLRRYAKVYIVTANPYLALRDAAESSTFWSALGVRVGVALPHEYDLRGWPSWDATVVYTMGSAVVGRVLDDDVAVPRPANAVQFGAVLLDEADAVILDQCNRDFSLIRRVATPAHAWSEPCDIAIQLDDEDIRQDPDSLDLRALLTSRGQQRVKDLGGRESGLSQLVLMREVELAYAAIRLAVPGHNYEVVDNRIVALDESSGWPLGHRPAWTPPLEHHLGLAHYPRGQAIHETGMLRTLTRFSHIAGASGTVINEALEYALLLGISTTRIEPRAPRRRGLLSDTTVETMAMAEANVVSSVVSHCETRPVLVATSTTEQAQRLAQVIRAAAPPHVTVRFADGESIAEERLFETAGRVGSVIVSTRVAGRGVDIQLDDEARRNGGAVLIALGHATEARYDRQLLGRVGRSGDPYTAWFVNCLEDPVMRWGANAATRFILHSVGSDVTMEAKSVDKTLHRIQRMMRRQRLQTLASRVVQDRADMAVYDMLRTWRLHLQRSWRDGSDGQVGPSFLAELASAYVSLLLPGVSEDAMDAARAGTIATALADLTGRRELMATLRVRLTGQPQLSAVQAVETALLTGLQEAVDANTAAHRGAQESLLRTGPALLDLWFLAELRQRAGHLARDAEIDPEQVAQLGRAMPTAAIPRISGSMATRRQAVYRRWLAGDGMALAPASSDAVAEDQAPAGDEQLGEPILAAEPVLAATPVLAPAPGDTRALDPADDTNHVSVPAVPVDAGLDDAEGDADLAPLAVLVGQLERGELAPTPEVLEALAEGLAEAEAARAPDSEEALDTVRRYRSGRTSTKVAIETLATATEAVVAARSRARFELANAHLPRIRYTQAHGAVMDDVRRVSEADLVESLCRNLLACREPSTLDELFERSKPVSDSSWPKYTLGGEGPAPLIERPIEEREFPRGREELVLYFVNALRADRGDQAPDENDVFPALNALLDDSPLPTLTDGVRVREAIERWRQHAIRRELPPWKRRKVDAHVKEFLAFLHDRGLAAPLPTGLRSRLSVVAHRVRRRIANPSMTLALGGVLGAAIVAGVAALVAVPSRFGGNPPLAITDGVLAVGAFGDGRALGAILAPATGAAGVLWLLRDNQGRGLPIEKLLFSVIAIAAALAVTQPWGADSVPVAARSLGLALVLYLVAHVFKACAWNVENFGQLRLLAGIVAVGAGAVALPRLAELVDGGDRPVTITAVGAALVFLATRPWRRADLPVDALHLMSGSTDQVEVVAAVRHISIEMGWPVHVSAVAVAWASTSLVNRVVTLGDGRAVVTLTVYAAVLTLWCARLAWGSCGVELWTSVLRRADEDYRPTPRRPSLEDGLAACRRSILGRELAAMAVVLGTGAAVFWPIRDELRESFPILPITIVLGLMAADLGWQFLDSVRIGLLQVGGATGDHLQDSLAESALSEVQNIARRLNRRLGAVALVAVLLSKIAEVLDVWNVVLDMVRWTPWF